MRLGILGGSFDPVHFGHLLLAEECLISCQLDQVWFVPAEISPHKTHRQPASAKARVEMLELATAGNSSFRISTIETERGGVSYTVDTLQRIAEQNPDSKLFFLLGADSLEDFPRWRQPGRICELAVPVVVRRYGAPEPDWNSLAGVIPDNRLAEATSYEVHMPRIELSSREMRQRIRQGKSVRYWTPRAVEEYIRAHQLYRGEDECFAEA